MENWISSTFRKLHLITINLLGWMA